MVTLTLILHGGAATFPLHNRICYFIFPLCKINHVNVPSMMLCYTLINCGLPGGNATQCLCCVLFSSQEVLPKIHEEKHYPCALVGTWNTWYGEQDQAGRRWQHNPVYTLCLQLFFLWNHLPCVQHSSAVSNKCALLVCFVLGWTAERSSLQFCLVVVVFTFSRW